MELILIDGGPASGKNTLGSLLIDKFREDGRKAILLDLDSYVERFNPRWIWNNEEQKEKDQLAARARFAEDITAYLKDQYVVLAIGERLLTTQDVATFMGRIRADPTTLLYHLSVPFALRRERLHARGPHTLIDLDKDQQDRDAIKNWLGYVYHNVHTPSRDAEELYELIKKKKGRMIK